MKNIDLIKIEILSSGKLLVYPDTTDGNHFEYIYRAALGVYWDTPISAFITPQPNEFSYLDWLNTILNAAASEYGIIFKITDRTLFVNIPDALKSQFIDLNKPTQINPPRP